MLNRYTVEISNFDPYPFGSIQHPAKDKQVKMQYSPSPKQLILLHENISFMLKLNSDCLVQLLSITDNKYFCKLALFFQYVPMTLRERKRAIPYQELQTQIAQIANLLSSNGIKTQLNLEDFGVTQEGRLKFILKPNFERIDPMKKSDLQANSTNNHYRSKAILKQLFPQRKFSSLSEANIADLSKKMSNIESRLEKMKKKRKKLRVKIPSRFAEDSNKDHSGSETSSHASTQKYGDGFNNTLQDHSPQWSQSFTQNTNRQDKPIIRPHKMSVGDERTISSNKKEQQQSSQKESHLKRRISDAIEKSKSTLTQFDKKTQFLKTSR